MLSKLLLFFFHAHNRLRTVLAYVGSGDMALLLKLLIKRDL